MTRHLCSSALVIVFVVHTIGPRLYGDSLFDVYKSNEPLDGQTFLLINTNSGRCLSITPDNLAVQGPLPEAATATERWKLVAVGDYFLIVNSKNDRVLAPAGNSTNQGSRLIAAIKDVDRLANQSWKFKQAGGHYSINSPVSGLVVAVAESLKEEGVRVLQWKWGNIADQIWMVQWIPTAPTDVAPSSAGNSPPGTSPVGRTPAIVFDNRPERGIPAEAIPRGGAKDSSGIEAPDATTLVWSEMIWGNEACYRDATGQWWFFYEKVVPNATNPAN